MIIISIFYQIILVFGESVLLGGFKIRDEVLDVYGVDAKYLESRYDEYFILYDRH